MRDADQEASSFITEQYEPLMAELAELADAAASRCNAALREVIAASAEREGVSRRVTALAALVARPEPGLVPVSRMESVLQAADAVILGGGEVPPRPRRDPRVPEHGEAIPEVSAA